MEGAGSTVPGGAFLKYMEEIQPEAEKPHDKHGPVASIIISIFVAVYLLFPFAYLYPLYLVYGKSGESPQYVDTAIGIFFYPLGKLADAVPAYGKLLAWEIRLIGWDDH